jgi:stage II sporulation protein AA (anti-sigma F factor antagonist)
VKLADVEFDMQGTTAVATITGEIDLSNVGTLRAALTEGVPNHATALVVDLSPIDYLDSSGIQLIYRLREDLRVRGQGLVLVIPPVSAANAALRLAGVENHIQTAGTPEEALARLDSSD